MSPEQVPVNKTDLIDDEEQVDQAGTEAMAAEVKKRAMDLVPHASEELREQVGQQAAANFKAEYAAKQAERQSQFDAEAQALLDKLKANTPLSEIDPSLGEVREPEYIDATENGSPIDEETGNWKPEFLPDSEQAPPTPGHPIAPGHLMEKDRGL
jgi:hypothetical protein